VSQDPRNMVERSDPSLLLKPLEVDGEKRGWEINFSSFSEKVYYFVEQKVVGVLLRLAHQLTLCSLAIGVNKG
jgi:hypothetical protein